MVEHIGKSYQPKNLNIVGIRYETSVNSQFSVSPKLIVIKKLINNTEFEATRTVGFEETLSTTSSFTETEGVRVFCFCKCFDEYWYSVFWRRVN